MSNTTDPSSPTTLSPMHPKPKRTPTATLPLTPFSLTFLGTGAAQPTPTRAPSALALRLGGAVWLFDCGEGTQRQLQRAAGVRLGSVEKVFVTHTHGDHVFGLVPLLASRLDGAGGTADGALDVRDAQAVQAKATIPPLEIYGPPGTRAYVRAGLTYTHTHLSAPYVVHELHFPPSTPSPFPFWPSSLPPHALELPGRDIAPAPDGTWPAFLATPTATVHAAPLAHSVPCIGYAVHEAPVPARLDAAPLLPHLQRTHTPLSALRTLRAAGELVLGDGTVLRAPPRRRGRVVVLLGDTHDAGAGGMRAYAARADVLVHEATNAWLPGVDPATKAGDTAESVRARARGRGHSTPEGAGAFAQSVGARVLVLTHFSARYAGADEGGEGQAARVMRAIGDLARAEFEGEVVCAQDLMCIDVALPE